MGLAYGVLMEFSFSDSGVCLADAAPSWLSLDGGKRGQPWFVWHSSLFVKKQNDVIGAYMFGGQSKEDEEALCFFW